MFSDSRTYSDHLIKAGWFSCLLFFNNAREDKVEICTYVDIKSKKNVNYINDCQRLNSDLGKVRGKNMKGAINW